MTTAAYSDDPFVLTDEYQVMPPLSDEEFEALKADIEANGVQDPIVHDEEMRVIDGHHRVQACRDLGRDMADVPTDVRAGYTDAEKRDLAYRLNLQRRHLEHGEKQTLVKDYLLTEWDGDNSGEWYENIANKLGVGSTTVGRAYKSLKSAGKLSHLGIFSKEDKREQVRQYLTKNPDATNREVANAVEADVSHATVGNWKNEYGWLEDDDEDDEPEQPKVQAFGRGKDAEDRAEQTEKLIDKATDEDAGEEVRETAAEKAKEVSRGETDPETAANKVRGTELNEQRETPEFEDDPVDSATDLNILNLYAGIGGNRKLWGDEVDVTAVEYDSEIADIYRDYFPQDTVVEADAHEYLLEHAGEFDFIWSSPPCPTHSQMEAMNHAQHGLRYPDMELYQEIILLQQHADRLGFNYCVENVISYYDPLIEPQQRSRHYFWSNFDIPEHDTPVLIKRGEEDREDRGDVGVGFDYDRHETMLGYDLGDYDVPKTKRSKALKNCVHPDLGKHILQYAFSEVIDA